MTINQRVSSIPQAEARLKAITHEIADAIHTKALTGPELKTKLDQLEAEYDAVETGLKNYKRAMAFRAGSEIGQPRHRRL